MKASPETNKQINKGLASMYKRMRDPEEREKQKLRDNLKNNVKTTTTRYGLG